MNYQILDSRNIDQDYSPESENAQSGKAVAEALSTKANLQFKTLNVTEYAVITDLLIGTHIYELQRLVVNSTGDYELYFTNGSYIITAPNEAFKEGNKYLISAHIDDAIGWVFDVVAEVIDLEDKVNITDIDQSFDAESENAQSGKAVAEAVKEEWVQVVNLTLEEDSIVDISTDVNGNPFNLKKFTMIIFHEAKEGGDYNKGVRISVQTKNNSSYSYLMDTPSYLNNTQSTHRIEGILEHWWTCKGFAGSGHSTYSVFPYVNSGRVLPFGNYDAITEPITSIRLRYGDYELNKGSKIEIWGVNA